MTWRFGLALVWLAMVGCYFGCNSDRGQDGYGTLGADELEAITRDVFDPLGMPEPAELGAPVLTHRYVSTTTSYELLDSAPVDRADAGVTYSLDALTLQPPDAFQAGWAVFGLSGLATDGSAYPTQLQVTADAPCWLAVGDFSLQTWVYMFCQESGSINLGNGSSYVSSSGACYVAVLAFENDVTLSQLQLTVFDDSGPLELWFYLQKNLYVESNLSAAIELVQRAAEAGYTTVVLADYKLGVIDLYDEDYTSNLQEFVSAANAAGVKVIPSLVPIGYSGAFFQHDPNLIEGQPVVDCKFHVSEGQADVVQDPATTVVNGGFEDHNGDSFPNWIQMDGAGESTFADTGVYHSGATSIRFEDFPAGNEFHNDRIRQDLTVEPWHCYAISFWLKTDAVAPVNRLWIRAFSPDVSELLSYLAFKIDATQDWRQYHLIFNSQDYSSIALYMGIWDGDSGRFWLDDVTIENTGLINLIRRPGAPLTVTSADGATVYSEGADYEYVSDPLMGHAGSYTGTFDLYHARPVISLTPASAISEGQDLLVDYYHAAFVYDMQGACCLTEPGVYDIIGTTLSRVNDLIDVDKVFIAVDELRCANWCALCQGQGETPAGLLADATQQIAQIAYGVNPAWTLMTWSDMYDPNHNAHDNYYLANGTMAGSWEGLASGWEIANWHQSGDRAATLAFFSGRGHRQVLAGYYDRGDPDPVLDDWLGEAAANPGVYAAMYTTWQDDYSDLEGWAQQVRDWEAAQ